LVGLDGPDVIAGGNGTAAAGVDSRTTVIRRALLVRARAMDVSSCVPELRLEPH
jgi:hypothetical protein